MRDTLALASSTPTMPYWWVCSRAPAIRRCGCRRARCRPRSSRRGTRLPPWCSMSGSSSANGSSPTMIARAPDSMAQAERRLLAREARGAGRRQILQQRVQLLRLAALREACFRVPGRCRSALRSTPCCGRSRKRNARCRPNAPRRPRAGSPGDRPRSAFPSGSPWSPAESACRARQRETRPCGYASGGRAWGTPSGWGCNWCGS